MAVRVVEKTLDEIKDKLSRMNTSLTKITYLESAINDQGFSFDIKRFLYEEIAKLYEERRMFDRAAKAFSNKATMDILFKEKIDSYLRSAELYAKGLKLDEADQMFIAASREANEEQRRWIKQVRKDIYMKLAKGYETSGRRTNAIKFYEKLVKMNLPSSEKDDIKRKMKTTYTSLGMFREARIVDGL